MLNSVDVCGLEFDCLGQKLFAFIGGNILWFQNKIEEWIYIEVQISKKNKDHK